MSEDQEEEEQMSEDQQEEQMAEDEDAATEDEVPPVEPEDDVLGDEMIEQTGESFPTLFEADILLSGALCPLTHAVRTKPI